MDGCYLYPSPLNYQAGTRPQLFPCSSPEDEFVGLQAYTRWIVIFLSPPGKWRTRGCIAFDLSPVYCCVNSLRSQTVFTLRVSLASVQQVNMTAFWGVAPYSLIEIDPTFQSCMLAPSLCQCWWKQYASIDALNIGAVRTSTPSVYLIDTTRRYIPDCCSETTCLFVELLSISCSSDRCP
jgi:hypothetical protein